MKFPSKQGIKLIFIEGGDEILYNALEEARKLHEEVEGIYFSKILVFINLFELILRTHLSKEIEAEIKRMNFTYLTLTGPKNGKGILSLFGEKYPELKNDMDCKNSDQIYSLTDQILFLRNSLNHGNINEIVNNFNKKYKIQINGKYNKESLTTREFIENELPSLSDILFEKILNVALNLEAVK